MVPFRMKRGSNFIALRELESAREAIAKQERSAALISRNAVTNAAAAEAKKRTKLHEAKQAVAALLNAEAVSEAAERAEVHQRARGPRAT